MISHSLGEPLKSLRSSISLAAGIGRAGRKAREPRNGVSADH
jgi:hypothetical protein